MKTMKTMTALAALCVLATGCVQTETPELAAQRAQARAQAQANGEAYHRAQVAKGGDNIANMDDKTFGEWEKQQRRSIAARDEYLVNHGWHWEQDASIWREDSDGNVYSEPHYVLVKDN